MITLICCLLALSSTAFGLPASGYGSYSSPSVLPVNVVRTLPVQNNYGQQPSYGFLQDTTPMPNGYGPSIVQPPPVRRLPMYNDQPGFPPSSYGSYSQNPIVSQQQLLLDQQRLLQQKIQESQIVTNADIACRGQLPETVIPLSVPQRYIVCVDDGKGYEQECPKGLVYHSESRRCERKLGPLENPCVSQPCLNGGQCLATNITLYQCDCQPGFAGINCELDARICQTQQPCGQSLGTKCQSFRFGAALQYMCIFQDNSAYGLNTQQVQQNPCQGVDGPRALAMTNKGFIMCDGESMFIESCPGGTVWDDTNQACVWPDMLGFLNGPFSDQPTNGYSKPGSYGPSVPPVIFDQPVTPSYGSIVSSVRRTILDQPKVSSSYGQVVSDTLPSTSWQTQGPVQQKGLTQAWPTTPDVSQTWPPTQDFTQGFSGSQQRSPMWQ